MFCTGPVAVRSSLAPRALAGASAALCLAVSFAASAEESAAKEACVPDAACVVVEYEENVAGEAVQLADALRLRLSSNNVHVIAEAVRGETGEAAAGGTPGGAVKDGARPRLFWIVHLRRLSKDLLLVAVDNLAGADAEDLVREVARGEDDASTVWTMALMIEGIIAPYFTGSMDAPALGAGLAIIEPPAVGGISAHEDESGPHYPRFRFIGLGVTLIGVVSAGSLAAGPVVSAEGVFAPRFMASFTAGWAGIADFSKGDVRGRAQFVPLEVGLGYAMYVSRLIELSVWTGLAVGFAVYRTELVIDSSARRTDTQFEPGALAALRLSFLIYGPVSCYLKGGVAIPFVHDRLANQGVEVYEASWLVPGFELGVHFRF
jgi:hypothetical protein